MSKRWMGLKRQQRRALVNENEAAPAAKAARAPRVRKAKAKRK